MPVVLVEVGGVARSGHEYGDRTGVEYEYPSGRYERMIQPGVRFVYQVPRLGYTGCGVVGAIRPSHQPNRLTCDVLSFQAFDRPVPLKDPTGVYYEADPTYWRDKVYWGQGVRPLSDERFEAITASASRTPKLGLPDPSLSGYASSKVARAVEDYSVGVVQAAMEARFGEPAHVMPRNNPGFDIRVGPASNSTRFVEVSLGPSRLRG